jgi:FRG domain
VPSLREFLEGKHLVLNIKIPTGNKADENARAWCSRLIGAMAWFSSREGAQYVWRGQRDASWSLQSRLNRHVATTLGQSQASAIREAEKDILAHVRHQRWNIEEGMALDLLTLAARLQHHGVPTRLLDVTKDPLVAAFFAAETSAGGTDTTDGAVVALRVPEGPTVSAEAGTEDAESLEEALVFSPKDAPYAWWEPPSVSSRVVTQRGCFLIPNVASGSAPKTAYSPNATIGLGIEKPEGGYTGQGIETFFKTFLDKPSPGRPPEKTVDVAMIVVPAKLKATLRTYLEALGLSRHSIYPDLDGFANSFPPS